MLLSNVSLLELLQKVLEYTWLRSPPSEPAYLSSEDALLCSGWLLVASLLFYQHRYNTEVRTTVVFRSRDWLNLKKEKLKKKKKSSLAEESGLLWPGICLPWLLFCYCPQVIRCCTSPAGLEASMLLKAETRIIGELESSRNPGGKNAYPSLLAQITFLFRIEYKAF